MAPGAEGDDLDFAVVPTYRRPRIPIVTGINRETAPPAGSNGSYSDEGQDRQTPLFSEGHGPRRGVAVGDAIVVRGRDGHARTEHPHHPRRPASGGLPR